MKIEFSRGVIPTAEITTPEMHIQVIEYHRGRAIWYVWFGDSNLAVRSGDAETLGQAQAAAMDAAKQLVTKILATLETVSLADTRTLADPEFQIHMELLARAHAIREHCAQAERDVVTAALRFAEAPYQLSDTIGQRRFNVSITEFEALQRAARAYGEAKAETARTEHPRRVESQEWSV